jgi:hypothetical protein
LIELTPEQVTPALRSLFPRHGHTWRRPLSVLDGTGGGLILTGDPTAPTWAATAGVSKWNTATTNSGSVRLARKLGYRTERQYRVLLWAQTRD